MKQLALLILIVLLAAVLTGCAPAKPEDTSLKIALIPVLDVIPVFIAQQNGYFAEQGIQVEGIPVKSAQERDVLIQTGQTDGMLTDLISTGLFNKDSVKVKAVYTTRRSYPNAPVFRVLAGPKTDIKSPTDLKGVPIGISQNTVIEYLTDRILEAEGLQRSDIAVVEVSAIPVRYEQLLNGNLKAATLPDPLAQAALTAGAKLVVDDSKYASESQSVLSFRLETLKAKPNTVKKFLVAWEKAVKELNAHPEKYQSVLIEQGRVPKSIENSYKMPPFPERGVPTAAEVADVVKWLREKGLVGREIPYADMVDSSFLPK
ncbi:MAG: ABC transporter substrate-binding protein [Chloroflexi bacterium]|nr:ABC transporter substrate-binding protein [Chloroflexota bacterium]